MRRARLSRGPSCLPFCPVAPRTLGDRHASSQSSENKEAGPHVLEVLGTRDQVDNPRQGSGLNELGIDHLATSLMINI